jgi:hypothetical protein
MFYGFVRFKPPYYIHFTPHQTSPLKGGAQEGVPVPLPTSGEGDRGWGEIVSHILQNLRYCVGCILKIIYSSLISFLVTDSVLLDIL